MAIVGVFARDVVRYCCWKENEEVELEVGRERRRLAVHIPHFGSLMTPSFGGDADTGGSTRGPFVPQERRCKSMTEKQE